MKSSFKELLLLGLMAVFTLALSCGGDDPAEEMDERTAQEIATELLTAGTWSLANGGSVMMGNNDLSSEFMGLTMTFNTNSQYRSVSSRIFSNTGTWNWTDLMTDTQIQMFVSGVSPITISRVNETAFVFSFTLSNDIGSISRGDYTIRLTR